MRVLAPAAIVLCAAATTAFAAPRETISFTNVNSDGEYLDATNTVLSQSVVGGYSVGRMHFSGTLVSVSPVTWESDSIFEVIPPVGESFFIQPSFFDDTFSSTTFTDLELVLDESIPEAAGIWTVRFFELWDDSGIDAMWTDWQLTLDDGPAAVDRYIESGDAGSLMDTAQEASGSGPLSVIRGELNDDEDMFKITICDPANFSAMTVYGSNVDTRLYLFNLDGTGVVGNDDAFDGVNYYYQSFIVAPLGLPAGDYYLAITMYNHSPVDAFGQKLWNDTPYEEIRVPDGPGAANPIAGWSGTLHESGFYSIFLTGACFVGPTGPTCGTADFDGDGDVGTDADIEAFFACLAGNCCDTCFAGGADFDGDGDTGTDADIEAFFRVLAGGNC
jgi:hypothetical protein